jgi:hypothetical protein
MIDQAIDRLFAVTKKSALPSIRKANSKRILATISAEISPLRLPDDLEKFWRRVDVESIAVTPDLTLLTPDTALQSWRQQLVEFPGMMPRQLLPFAYESHDYLSVELESGRGDGGAVYEWGASYDGYFLRHASVSSYLDQLATMIELENFVIHTRPGRSWVEFDPDRQWNGVRAVRLAADLQTSGKEPEPMVNVDAALWPARWLESDGVTERDLNAVGATSTVAQLKQSAAGGRTVEGTIQGRVKRLVGAGGDTRVTVDDGTGELDIWCPAKVCRFGPVVRQRFEFDVVVTAVTPPPDTSVEHAEILRLAASGDAEALQDAARAFHRKAFETPAAATATAIRSLSR